MGYETKVGVKTTAATTSTNQPALELLLALWRSKDRHHIIGILDKATGRFRNIPVKSAEEAVSYSMAYSAIGLDAYFAIAEYETSDNRKSENAGGAFTFIADIDVGPDKAAAGTGYATVEEATAALTDFCNRTGVPLPSYLVASGSGLHAYHVFDEFLSRDEWLVYAGKLKTLMKLLGLRVDPSRTADIASVLRVPGTFNLKYSPPRPVKILSYKKEHIELTVMLDAIDAAMVNFAVEADAGVKLADTKANELIPAPLATEYERSQPNLLVLASALKVLTPDCDEKAWKFHRIAPMAYEARYFPEHHDALYNLAKCWSSGELCGVPSVKWAKASGNGQSGKQCFDGVWKRFLNDQFTGRRASLGTIYFHAQKSGWVYPSTQQVAHGDDEFGTGAV